MTPERPATTATTWFRRIVRLGIASNLALALPTLLAPQWAFRTMDQPAPSPAIWAQFAALLLVLLSAFYEPGARDPYRYRANAWLAVASRLAGVLFFLGVGREYWMLGVFDLAFFLPQAALLAGVERAAA